jgi:hypothetical protein
VIGVVEPTEAPYLMSNSPLCPNSGSTVNGKIQDWNSWFMNSDRDKSGRQLGRFILTKIAAIAKANVRSDSLR